GGVRDAVAHRARGRPLRARRRVVRRERGRSAAAAVLHRRRLPLVLDRAGAPALGAEGPRALFRRRVPPHRRARARGTARDRRAEGVLQRGGRLRAGRRMAAARTTGEQQRDQKICAANAFEVVIPNGPAGSPTSHWPKNWMPTTFGDDGIGTGTNE